MKRVQACWTPVLPHCYRSIPVPVDIDISWYKIEAANFKVGIIIVILTIDSAAKLVPEPEEAIRDLVPKLPDRLTCSIVNKSSTCTSMVALHPVGMVLHSCCRR